MPARNVRVDIPISSPLKMENLGDAILERHNELGPGAPLNTPEIDMGAYETVHTLFTEKFNLSNGHHAQGEALTQQANVALGVAPEQNKDTPGTIYYHDLRIRNHLLLVNEGTEEELSTYGFNVVISMTPLPGEDEPQTFTGTIAAGTTVREIAMMVHTHPTLCEVLDEAFKAAIGRKAH